MAFDELFYPIIVRRSNYIGKGAGKVSRYSDYRVEIQEDCLFRCVYCDIEYTEIGFEGMQLDHFRPENYFPELSDEPNNLVLSCPKCNRFKWYHWPGSKKIDECSYAGGTGFLDPFQDDRREYFTIDTNGTAYPLKDPAGYMIKLLRLNREARIQLRRKRILRHMTRELLKNCTDLIKTLGDAWRAGEIPFDSAMESIQFLNDIIAELSTIR